MREASYHQGPGLGVSSMQSPNFVLIWRYEVRDGERVVALARVGTHQYLDIG